MNINKDNYEAYFLDYFEGNLSTDEVEELFAFMEMHPEVKNEFEGFEMITVATDQATFFEDKDLLKKNEILSHTHITINNIEEYLVAELEGLLSDNESIQLQEFIASNPSFEKDRRIFSHTRLNANSSIFFPEKAGLMHIAIPFGNITETNYATYMVAEVEGELTPEDRLELEQFLLLNPQLEQEHKLFGLTRLQADSSIIFTDKTSLKHSILPIRRILLYSLSAAASLALLFGAYFTWQNRVEPAGIASNSNTVKPNISVGKPVLPLGTNESATAISTVKYASNTPYKHLKSNESQPSAVKTNAVNTQEGSSGRNTDQMPILAAIACKEVKSHDYVEPEFIFIRTSQMHRNEYMELYYNVRLSEQILYAQLNESDKNPERTIFNSLAARASSFFNPKRNEIKDPNSNLSVWTFAELGVKTYNNITQDNVKLDLKRDDEGKVVAYNLSGDRLDLQRDVNK